MVKQICRRLPVLEDRLDVTKMPRIRGWSDEIEAKIDRFMAMPDSADFSMGMWGQVFEKNGHLLEEMIVGSTST